MSAELLREAAALMRERAENSADARTGPITWSSSCTARTKDSMTVLHYDSWKPAVALAVADLLTVFSMMPSASDQTDMAVAVRLAKTYLGRDA